MAQILHIVSAKFPENFLIFIDFPKISIAIPSYLNIFPKSIYQFFATVLRFFCKILSGAFLYKVRHLEIVSFYELTQF